MSKGKGSARGTPSPSRRPGPPPRRTKSKKSVKGEAPPRCGAFFISPPPRRRCGSPGDPRSRSGPRVTRGPAWGRAAPAPHRGLQWGGCGTGRARPRAPPRRGARGTPGRDPGDTRGHRPTPRGEPSAGHSRCLRENPPRQHLDFDFLFYILFFLAQRRLIPPQRPGAGFQFPHAAAGPPPGISPAATARGHLRADLTLQPLRATDEDGEAEKMRRRLWGGGWGRAPHPAPLSFAGDPRALGAGEPSARGAPLPSRLLRGEPRGRTQSKMSLFVPTPCLAASS